jgi:hypothetical protein
MQSGLNILNLDREALDRIALENDASQGQKMIKAVFNFLGRFVSYPSEHAHVAHALWCVHTHLMPAWESTPRIAFLSPEPASGKSRALEATEPLVPRPMEAVNMSPSALFRSIGSEDGLPTILFDEIDTIFGAKAKEHEELRGLLNAGHRRGAKTYRSVVRGKVIGVEAIEAYSAVALAGLGFLPDTLLSRSIVIRMRRRHAEEYVEPFRRRLHHPVGDAIRYKIETWAASATEQIAWPDLPLEIQDRNADVWEPLIAIADAIGGDWPARARAAAVALVSDVSELEPSLGVRLLSDLKTVFGNQKRMTSKSIIASLISLEEAPWHDLRGKPIDERGLAHRLKAYGIRSISIRLGETTGKGYRAADFYDAWKRYLPSRSENSGTSGTPATSQIPIAEIRAQMPK